MPGAISRHYGLSIPCISYQLVTGEEPIARPRLVLRGSGSPRVASCAWVSSCPADECCLRLTTCRGRKCGFSSAEKEKRRGAGGGGGKRTRCGTPTPAQTPPRLCEDGSRASLSVSPRNFFDENLKSEASSTRPRCRNLWLQLRALLRGSPRPPGWGRPVRAGGTGRRPAPGQRRV